MKTILSLSFLREALITSRSPQIGNVRLSVRPSVRNLCDFCEEHMDPGHPQIPFAKRALLCGGTKPEKLDTYATSYVQILMITFLIKNSVFTKKVPSFVRCENV